MHRHFTLSAADRQRFWSKVNKTDHCWSWSGRPDHRGYGMFYLNGRQEKAHRVSWFLANGTIPPGMSILHRCDNPICVNPAHLFPGTIADNNADMRRKMRHRWGERHQNAILTEETARKIQSLRRNGLTYREIGKIVGVKQQTAYKVVNFTWQHLMSQEDRDYFLAAKRRP